MAAEARLCWLAALLLLGIFSVSPELPLSLLFAIMDGPLLCPPLPPTGGGGGFRLTSHSSYLLFSHPLSDDLMGSPPH